MLLELKRRTFTDKSTIGDLQLDGVKCVTLEDCVREGPKVPGKTAIPEGRYHVVLDFSNRFRRIMPHILDVPGFTGVRIHPGNTDADTEGCILIGLVEGPDWIGQSRNAFAILFEWLQVNLKTNEVWIEIKHEESHELENLFEGAHGSSD